MRFVRIFAEGLTEQVLEEMEQRRNQSKIDEGSEERFDKEEFGRFWRPLLSDSKQTPCGAAFLLLDSEDKMCGWIFGVAVKDPTTGIVIAQQTNWKTYGEGRGSGGMLLNILEGWAQYVGARELSVHVPNLQMANKLNSTYKLHGMVFVKSLKE
jgi:hypothetical protein